MGRGKKRILGGSETPGGARSHDFIQLRIASADKHLKKKVARLKALFAAHPGDMPVKITIGDKTFGAGSITPSAQLRGYARQILDGVAPPEASTNFTNEQWRTLQGRWADFKALCSRYPGPASLVLEIGGTGHRFDSAGVDIYVVGTSDDRFFDLVEQIKVLATPATVPGGSPDEARADLAATLRDGPRPQLSPTIAESASEEEVSVPTAFGAPAGARYPQFGMFGACVVGELDDLEQAVTELLFRRFLTYGSPAVEKANEEEGERWLRLEDIYVGLYDHFRDKETGEVYLGYKEEGRPRYARLVRDDLVESELAPEVVARLEGRQAVASNRAALQTAKGPDGSPLYMPPRPEHIRRKVIAKLRAKQIPVVSTKNPDHPGYRLTTNRADLEQTQASERSHVATTLRRLDQQLEVADRLDHYLKTGEWLVVEVELEDELGPNSYRARAQSRKSTNRGASASEHRQSKDDDEWSFEKKVLGE